MTERYDLMIWSRGTFYHWKEIGLPFSLKDVRYKKSPLSSGKKWMFISEGYVNGYLAVITLYTCHVRFIIFKEVVIFVL